MIKDDNKDAVFCNLIACYHIATEFCICHGNTVNMCHVQDFVSLWPHKASMWVNHFKFSCDVYFFFFFSFLEIRGTEPWLVEVSSLNIMYEATGGWVLPQGIWSHATLAWHLLTFDENITHLCSPLIQRCWIIQFSAYFFFFLLIFACIMNNDIKQILVFICY